MNPMLTKLADALWNDRESRLPARTRMKWPTGTPEARAFAIMDVIAILKAIRDPDGGMIEAMTENSGIDGYVNEFSPIVPWQAGIDHILTTPMNTETD